jgi:hypothetical protein
MFLGFEVNMVIKAGIISMVVFGSFGWLILVVPDLHFLYKNLMPAIGSLKYLAFAIMGLAMFISLPVFVTRKAFSFFCPSQVKGITEKLAMVMACFVSVMISRLFM